MTLLVTIMREVIDPFLPIAGTVKHVDPNDARNYIVAPAQRNNRLL